MDFKDCYKVEYVKMQAAELTEETKIVDGKLEHVFVPGDMVVKTNSGHVYLTKDSFDRNFIRVVDAEFYSVPDNEINLLEDKSDINLLEDKSEINLNKNENYE